MTAQYLNNWHPAAATKLFGVHIGLYTKSIINLGTKKHEDYIRRAFTLDDIGSFGLTELGTGSNVKGVLTTAKYDKKNN